jgi:hypothetical protein
LEIHEARQWRAEYQSVKDFAKNFAKMSKGHLMKCVDSAAIRLIMVEAELDAVAPTGRQVEALAKVAPDYRIPAWLYALEVFEVDGKSDAVAGNALRDFCRDRNLTFGRRQPNGSKNIGLSSSLLSNQSQFEMDPMLQKARNPADWTNISEAEERTLSNILPTDLLEKVERELSGERPGMVVRDLLSALESHYCDPQTSQRMLEMMRLVGEKNPLMAENLIKLAVFKLIDVIEEKLEQQIKEKRRSKS